MLLKPLEETVGTIRRAGNLGAHFDPEKDPDEPLARLALDLLGYFLEYTFVLAEKAKALQQEIASVDQAAASSDV